MKIDVAYDLYQSNRTASNLPRLIETKTGCTYRTAQEYVRMFAQMCGDKTSETQFGRAYRLLKGKVGLSRSEMIKIIVNNLQCPPASASYYASVIGTHIRKSVGLIRVIRGGREARVNAIHWMKANPQVTEQQAVNHFVTAYGVEYATAVKFWSSHHSSNKRIVNPIYDGYLIYKQKSDDEQAAINRLINQFGWTQTTAKNRVRLYSIANGKPSQCLAGRINKYVLDNRDMTRSELMVTIVDNTNCTVRTAEFYSALFDRIHSIVRVEVAPTACELATRARKLVKLMHGAKRESIVAALISIGINCEEVDVYV